MAQLEHIEAIEKRLWSAADTLRANSNYASNEYFLPLIREFFYKEGLIHFDETPCEKFSLADDLTDDVWTLFRRRAKIPAEMEPVTALTNLHLLGVDGRMSHAGAWLLARDIRKFNTSADVACALFLGTEKVLILDRNCQKAANKQR